MKSLLRFIVLFALIVVGKLTREPAALPEMARLLGTTQQTPVRHASLLSEFISQPATPAAESRLWQGAAPAATSVVSYQ